MPPKKLKAKEIIGDAELSDLSDVSDDGSDWSESSDSGNEKIAKRVQGRAQGRTQKQNMRNDDSLDGDEIGEDDLGEDESSDDDSETTPSGKIKKILKQSKKPSSTSSKKPPSKPTRGPGRPRKNPVLEALPHFGIVKNPGSKKNKMELQYGNPISVKKIFTLLRAMQCKQIKMTFEKTKFRISAVDHLMKSDIYIECDGSRMNRYYCSEKYSIQMEHETFSKIFNQMDNNTHELRFIAKKTAKDDTVMYIGFIDRILESDATHSAAVASIAHPKIEAWVNPKKYPLSFTLESKYFRQKIKQIETSKAEKFLIQKHGSQDLRISYKQGGDKSTKGDTTLRFRNPDKIKLRANLSSNEVISVPISVRYVKKFAASMISDNIEIRADPKEPTIFVCDVDPDENGKPAFKVMVHTSTFEYNIGRK